MSREPSCADVVYNETLGWPLWRCPFWTSHRKPGSNNLSRERSPLPSRLFNTTGVRKSGPGNTGEDLSTIATFLKPDGRFQ
jgi:hypothetical protein